MKTKRHTLQAVVLAMLVITATVSVVQSLENKTSIEIREPAYGGISTTILTYGGTTLYVGGGGPDNYTTIQDALDHAQDGDRIYVYPGLYTENIDINQSILLISESPENTIIESNDERDEIIVINADAVTLSGFTVQQERYGILIKSNSTTLFNNIFQNISAASIITTYSYRTFNTSIRKNIFLDCVGIVFINVWESAVSKNFFQSKRFRPSLVLSNSEKNDVSDNLFDFTQKPELTPNNRGIRIYCSSQNHLQNNTILSLPDLSFSGIFLEGSTDNVLINNSLVHCGVLRHSSSKNEYQGNRVNGKPLVYLTGESDKIVDDAGQVILVDCSKITIENLVLSDIEQAIVLENSQSCIVRNNQLSHVSQAIMLNDSSDILVENNIISKNLYTKSINLDKSSDNQIRENHIENSYWGIAVFGPRNTVINNTLVSNNRGILVSDLNNAISLNTFTKNDYGVYVTRALSTVVTNNNFDNNNVSGYFHTAYRTKWNRNYWDELESPWMVIHGVLFSFYLGDPTMGGYEVEIPWANIDWQPAQTPNALD